MKLQPCPKRYTIDQDKATSPDTTAALALERLLAASNLPAPELTQRHRGIENVQSFWARAGELKTFGKGLTLDQSRASALMELVERSSWTNFAYKQAPGYRIDSWQALMDDDLFTVPEHYFACNLLDQTCHAELAHEALRAPMRWVHGWSLTDEREFLYPLSWHNLTQTTNGLAAGNTMVEAIGQGLCEVIEREAVFRWFVDRVSPHDLDPDSITHPLTRAAINEVLGHGIHLVLKDLTAIVGVPCFSVHGIYQTPDGPRPHFGSGQGCHPDPEKALIRALTEYVASHDVIPTNDHPFPASHPMTDPRVNADMLEASAGVSAMAELPNLAHDDLLDELRLLRGKVEQAGYQVVVVDKTHPSIQIPTVRVILPGMRALYGGEVSSLRMTLACMYHEAGDADRSRGHITKGLFEILGQTPALRKTLGNPMLAAMLPVMLRNLSPRLFFGDDYMDTLGRHDMLEKRGMSQVLRLLRQGSLLQPKSPTT